MSDTPRTDQALKGDISVGMPPEVTDWNDAIEFCEHLERELNQMHKRYRVLKEAIRKLQDTTVGI